MTINGTIMSGELPVAAIEAGRITPVRKDRMPLYLTRGGDLEEWLTSRAIDRHRPNSRLLKKVLRLTDTNDVTTVLRAHAASVTDDYWLKTAEEPNLIWEQVRFSENSFAELALTGSADSFNRGYTAAQLAGATPELTNTGSFEKCWKLEDGVWYMYKQGTALERFSELFISKLGMALGISSAEYIRADRTIKTKDFTGGQYNFEPAAALVGDNEEYAFNYDHIESLKEGMGRQYLDLLYMDALCFNMDRHTHNYGFLRSRETGEVLCMAPNFDNNIALVSRGYVDDPEKSNGMLIQLFLELLETRGLSYTPPETDERLIRKLAAETLPEAEIDRDYVVKFILNRGQRLEEGIKSLMPIQGQCISK